MLIHFITRIKTTLVLLLFTVGVLNLQAVTEPNYLLQNDTITTVKPSDVFIIPENARKAPINFQVNSEINYLNFSHFAKTESRKTYYQAWLIENELKRLSTQADSLRTSYSNSSSDQKEKISAQILKSEEQLMSLNEEVPVLYEKARAEENLYWQSASHDDVIRFQGKVRAYQDSLRQIADQLSKKAQQDTFTFYPSKPKTAVVTEPVSAIIYKIQVGAFKGKMSETAAKSIKKLSVLRKVENSKDEKGVMIYTTGSLKSFQEAETLQAQIKLEGIKNASIVAYNKGKKITLEEAKKPIKETAKP